MAVDLTSFDTFRKTAGYGVAEAASFILMRGQLKTLGKDADGDYIYALGKDEFELASGDSYLAAWVALYRRKCRKQGVPVGPIDV